MDDNAIGEAVAWSQQLAEQRANTRPILTNAQTAILAAALASAGECPSTFHVKGDADAYLEWLNTHAPGRA